MPSCNDVTDCPTGALGTSTPNSWDIVSPILNKGMPLVQVTRNLWPSLGTLFFNMEYEQVGEEVFIKYKFKNGGAGVGSKTGGTFIPVQILTNEDCAIEWREEAICEAYTTVASNSSGNTITVSNINDLLGIKRGSKLLIVRDGTKNIVTAEVHSISTNVITLANSQTAVVTAGDKVYRGAYNRDPSCTAVIDNSYTVKEKKKYVSYFRKMNLTHNFRTCELSLDRYSLNGEDGTNTFLQSKMNAGEKGFVKEFMNVVYWDKNLPEGNSVTEFGGAETMGLFPAIQKAQEATGRVYMKDYSACCSDETESDCVNTDQMIGAFLDTILDVYETGFYSNGVVTVACNNAQLRAILKMAPDLNEYFGLTVMTQTNMQDGFQLGADLPRIKYGAITIDFVHEPEFDKMPWPVHVILPRDMISIFQRKHPYLDENMQLTDEVNGLITDGIPMLQFIDRTKFETNGFGDCYVFRAQIEFGLVWAGVDKHAYSVGFNFGSCGNDCNLCESEPVILLEALEDE